MHTAKHAVFPTQRISKGPLKERFDRPPYIKFSRGSDSGMIGFDKTLSDEDIAFVREQLKTINGNSITWDVPDGVFSLIASASVTDKNPRGL